MCMKLQGSVFTRILHQFLIQLFPFVSHVALHERDVALHECHVAIHVRRVALLTVRQ